MVVRLHPHARERMDERGATEEEVIASEMHPDPDNLEEALLKELEETTGAKGETIIAFALVRG